MKISNSIKIILVLVTSMFLYSCSGNGEVEIPDQVLSVEKMAQVMTDMHLMEASMNLNISNAENIANGGDLQVTALGLLKKNNTTKEEYETSFAFYADHPSLLSEVYKQVLTNLSQLQAKVANEKEPVKKDTIKKDSLQKDSIRKKIKTPRKP